MSVKAFVPEPEPVMAAGVFCSGCGSSKTVANLDDPILALCQRCLDDRGQPMTVGPTGSQRGSPVFVGGVDAVWLGPEWGAKQ
jgi:hypothetical protein